MDSISFVPFRNDDGLELVINTKTGECFASKSAYSRMSGVALNTISNRLNRGYKGVHKSDLKMAEIITEGGLQGVQLLTEDIITNWIVADNPDVATKLMRSGVRMFLHQLAGFQYQVVEQIKPKTALELAKEQVKLLEELELKELQIKLLEEANQQQAEVIDELFDYSSIIRIAKFNDVSETNFAWSKLKAASKLMDKEIKVAPCPRFGKKNLYHHDVWRYCYPNCKLPETTTLVIQK